MWLIQKTHERGETDDVAGQCGSAQVEVGGVFRRAVEDAAGSFVAFIGKEFIGNPHLHVVGLASEDFDRLVLSLPSKSGNRAVVSAGVWAPGDRGALIGIRTSTDPHSVLLIALRIHLLQDDGFRNGFDQAASESRCRNAEDQIVAVSGLLKVGLCDGAPRCVASSGNREEIVNATIGMAQVGGVGKARFTNRAGAGDEGWDLVGCALISGDRNLRIRSRAAASDRGLRVTLRATLCIESWAESKAGAGYGSLHRLDFGEGHKTGREERLLIRGETCDGVASCGRTDARSGIARARLCVSVLNGSQGAR